MPHEPQTHDEPPQLPTSSESVENYAQNIVDTVRESILVLDRDLRVVSANPSFYRTFQVTAPDTEG